MTNEELLDQATERLDAGLSADHDNRELGMEDMRFRIGEQWNHATRQEREAANKPCLTFNMLAQHVRSVTGQLRSINPAIRVGPGDNRASKEVAEIYEGLVRQIEYSSDATSVYEFAAECAASCGIGNFRIRTDYVGPDTFDQEILIERIYDPFAVVWDHMARAPDRSDAKWCFILDRMKRKDFEAEYPDKAAVSAESPDETLSTRMTRWLDGADVVVAEYYWIEETAADIGTFNGQTVSGDDLKQLKADAKALGVTVKTRKAMVPKVMWAKVSGADVLDGPTEIPGRYIPVVAVTGEEIHAGDISYRSGVIRHAKDAQVLYNYARSVGAELQAMQPRAPFMVTAKQVAGFEDYWKAANTTNYPYLPYTPDEKAPGAPQRIQPPVPSSAIMAEIQMAAMDIQRTTGIYDSALGARSNETSGVAIDARKEESQNANSIYADNLMKAVAHGGCIVVGMIPVTYDAPRMVRIMGEDDETQLKAVNQIVQTVDGIAVENDMTVGKYDVRISVGPRYATKRKEAASALLEFTRALPQVAQIAPDLIAGAQDWPDADRLAERLKKTVPPQFLEGDETAPEEAQRAAQAAQVEQQKAQAQEELAMRKMAADVAEAEAKAQKAQADAMKAQAEAAQVTGAFNGMVEARAQEMVGQIAAQQQQALAPQY